MKENGKYDKLVCNRHIERQAITRVFCMDDDREKGEKKSQQKQTVTSFE